MPCSTFHQLLPELSKLLDHTVCFRSSLCVTSSSCASIIFSSPHCIVIRTSSVSPTSSLQSKHHPHGPNLLQKTSHPLRKHLPLSPPPRPPLNSNNSHPFHRIPLHFLPEIRIHMLTNIALPYRENTTLTSKKWE